MLIIGLAGGIASGKSFVAGCFEQLGAALIDADRVGHEVLAQSSIQSLLVDRWGSEIVVNHQVDRRRLAAIVFDPDDDGEQLLELERITHPPIRQRIESRITELRTAGQVPAVVLDAPIMFRAGWGDLCEQIVFVDVPVHVRQQRAALRGWKEGELERRESRQVAIDKKRKMSTCVVDSSGSEQKTRHQVKSLWLQWKLSPE